MVLASITGLPFLLRAPTQIYTIIAYWVSVSPNSKPDHKKNGVLRGPRGRQTQTMTAISVAACNKLFMAAPGHTRIERAVRVIQKVNAAVPHPDGWGIGGGARLLSRGHSTM